MERLPARRRAGAADHCSCGQTPPDHSPVIWRPPIEQAPCDGIPLMGRLLPDFEWPNPQQFSLKSSSACPAPVFDVTNARKLLKIMRPLSNYQIRRFPPPSPENKKRPMPVDNVTVALQLWLWKNCQKPGFHARHIGLSVTYSMSPIGLD